jgi:hypothetical protein
MISGCANTGHALVVAQSTASPLTEPAPSALAALPPVAAPAAAEDANTARCRALISALIAGSLEGAEQDFGDQIRAALPPLQLGAVWQMLTTKHGTLASWRVVKRDAPDGKDRFTLELEFADGPMSALVVFAPAGKVVGLFFADVPQQRPASPEAPDPRVKEVEITVGPLNLPGYLARPSGTERKLREGVVLIAGSGPNDRDETVNGARPLRDLAYFLAAHGIVSVRWDKRTRVHPEWFDPKTMTVEYETIADAVAAVGVLRSWPEVDPQRVFVVGHSLGALLAPEVAARAGGVAGLVLLAAPGRPVLEVTLEQLRSQGESGASFESLAARVKALPALPGTEVLLGVPASYWQDLAKRDEMALAKKLGRPVLLLRGASDAQVAAIDQDNWLHALVGHVPVAAATLPGLGHMFIPEPAVDGAPRHVRDDALERIAAFIDNPPKH